MTEHLVAAHATLHIREPLAGVFSALKLVPDAAGPVTLLRRFGHPYFAETVPSSYSISTGIEG